MLARDQSKRSGFVLVNWVKIYKVSSVEMKQPPLVIRKPNKKYLKYLVIISLESNEEFYKEE